MKIFFLLLLASCASQPLKTSDDYPRDNLNEIKRTPELIAMEKKVEAGNIERIFFLEATDLIEQGFNSEILQKELTIKAFDKIRVGKQRFGTEFFEIPLTEKAADNMMCTITHKMASLKLVKFYEDLVKKQGFKTIINKRESSDFDFYNEYLFFKMPNEKELAFGVLKIAGFVLEEDNLEQNSMICMHQSKGFRKTFDSIMASLKKQIRSE